MSWSTAVRGTPPVLCVTGELDIVSAEHFVAAFDAYLVHTAGRRPVIDLSELAFIDSTGMRALFKAAQHCPNGLVLRNPSPYVEQWLLVRANGFFQVERVVTP